MSAKETRIASKDANFTFVSTPGQDAVASWIDRVYRPERLDRDAGTRQRIVNDRVHDLVAHGGTLVSSHDAVSRRVEWLIDSDSDLVEVGD